jgi:hypothetical protein
VRAEQARLLVTAVGVLATRSWFLVGPMPVPVVTGGTLAALPSAVWVGWSQGDRASAP